MPAAVLLFLLSCIPSVPTLQLPGPVVRPFVAPACPRCAGHRGITVAVPAGTTVRALTAGIVVFDGHVARRRFLVVRTPGGDLVTYGDLAGPPHERGQVMAAGSPVGQSNGTVYVGTRRRGLAVDPRFVIGSGAARLVPPPALACPVGPAQDSR